MFLSSPGFCQNPEQIQYQEKADSIVSFFLGSEIFQRYVKLDLNKSEYRSSENVRKNDFTTRPTFIPDSFFFHYNFRHPKFSGETFVITFTLDSAGQFIPGKSTRGIIRIESDDATWTTGRQAIAISKDVGKNVKKRTLRLVWESTGFSYDAFLKSKDLRDIWPGDIVWHVDGKELFRGHTYSGTFEVAVQTGRVVKRFAIPWD
jgi:hypothetical protein